MVKSCFVLSTHTPPYIRDSSVSLVTHLRAGGPGVGFFLQEQIFFSSSVVLMAPGAKNAPCSLGVGVICTGVKADGDEAEHRC